MFFLASNQQTIERELRNSFHRCFFPLLFQPAQMRRASSPLELKLVSIRYYSRELQSSSEKLPMVENRKMLQFCSSFFSLFTQPTTLTLCCSRKLCTSNHEQRMSMGMQSVCHRSKLYTNIQRYCTIFVAFSMHLHIL